MFPYTSLVNLINSERKALGIRVVDFCREAHISRVTYYELLKGNNTPSRYTADSYAACRRDMIASVNLQFPSFAPPHRLSKLISALGLASVATAEPLGSQRSHHTQYRNHASLSCDFSMRY